MWIRVWTLTIDEIVIDIFIDLIVSLFREREKF